MGKKWQRIDPAEIKVGDRVRQVDETSEYRQTISGVVTYVTPADIEMGGASLSPNIGTWYVRRPKPSRPLTRPDEPPVGTFFRVDRPGKVYIRRIEAQRYLPLNTGYGEDQGYRHWNDITKPGDIVDVTIPIPAHDHDQYINDVARVVLVTGNQIELAFVIDKELFERWSPHLWNRGNQ